MVDPNRGFIHSAFAAIFGDYLPLARHVAQNTAVFLTLLFFFFLVRTAVSYLFTEDEFVVKIIHIVDSYAALLGIVGYVVWTALDMYLLLRQQRLRALK